MSILRGHLRVYIRVQRSKCLNPNFILSIREIKEKNDIISLSQEFFDGADIDIEVRAKVTGRTVFNFSVNSLKLLILLDL